MNDDIEFDEYSEIGYKILEEAMSKVYGTYAFQSQIDIAISDSIDTGRIRDHLVDGESIDLEEYRHDLINKIGNQVMKAMEDIDEKNKN